jgi:hypothetical protein
VPFLSKLVGIVFNQEYISRKFFEKHKSLILLAVPEAWRSVRKPSFARAQQPGKLGPYRALNSEF